MSSNLEAEKKVDIPDAILGNELGAAKELPQYKAAKSGSREAGDEVALALVNQSLLDKINAVGAGKAPILQPVYAVEASGENVIPQTAAFRIASSLGYEIGTTIIQSNSPKRTSMEGLERIFNRPSFFGHVEPNRSYIILDDTLTQGGTFAALEKHIVEGGGKVIAAVALTGKNYSAPLRITEGTLWKLRSAHGDIEEKFKAETGRSFEALTESEARYLSNFKPAQEVRKRILEGRPTAVPTSSQGLSGQQPMSDKISSEAISAIGDRLVSSLMSLQMKKIPGPKPS
jgi:hypothetical protein